MKLRLILFITSFFMILHGTSCAQKNKENDMDKTEESNTHLEIATFGSGCFWCTEAVFERLNGVEKVISGYSGGHSKNPSYKEVCAGTTGHAEVCQIYYNPEIISFDELLEVFWHTHDPTTLNRQGNDVGPQYRSVIFYSSEEQKKLAEKSKREMNASGSYMDPIVTEISPLVNFYEAEEYHQDYFNNNPAQPYCSFVIVPKVNKLKAKYSDKLK
ncbi:MAG: peptide methionine sulfoxide reductase [Bacteroides sp. SM23_62_1]|nr:MAG: peptide methionine sulfoxide reductase [Bacteroides sp. SM23_62_1]